MIEINQPSPNISYDAWVLGRPVSIPEYIGRVILVEVFQVNCPGCLMYALPEAIRLHRTYKDKGLAVIGLATAFEDYDKNTLENLQRLIEYGEVIGEAYQALDERGLLKDGKVDWRLPFPVGMDRVVPDDAPVTDERVQEYASKVLPDFDLLNDRQKGNMLEQVRNYLQNKTMKAETFERFSLQGTPSSILINRQGILKNISFGQLDQLQPLIEELLES